MDWTGFNTYIEYIEEWNSPDAFNVLDLDRYILGIDQLSLLVWTPVPSLLYISCLMRNSQLQVIVRYRATLRS